MNSPERGVSMRLGETHTRKHDVITSRTARLPATLVWFAVGAIGLTLAIGARGGEPRDHQIADGAITEAIVHEMDRDPVVDRNAVDVKTTDGIVEISGSVPHLLARDQAVQIAEQTRGVRSVVDRIKVRPIKRSDDAIEADVRQALFEDPATDSYELDVDVQGARVTLAGAVDSWAEKWLTADVVKGIDGMAAIKNDIEVVHKEDRLDREVYVDVKRRLELAPYIQADAIDVEVNNGHVSLTGVVRSGWVRARAGQLAWVAGVEGVDTDALDVQWWRTHKAKRPPLFRTESSGEIEQAVKDALMYDPRVPSSSIAVVSSGGSVMLVGTVDSLATKEAAEEDAKNTEGVWRVKNRIKVRPDVSVTDESIRQKIDASLSRDAVVGPLEFTPLVRNQKVYLYGEAPNYYAVNRAREIVSRVKGVVAVANRIEVVPDANVLSDSKIKEEIEEQYFWSLAVDGGDIDVAVNEGVATLSGPVDSWHELKAAVENAFQGGARAVGNELEVEGQDPNIYPQQYYPSLFWGM